MLHKLHSVNQVYITHPEILPLSKSTFYKYINLGILNVNNIDLPRKVRYKVKKEYDYQIVKANPKLRAKNSILILKIIYNFILMHLLLKWIPL